MDEKTEFLEGLEKLFQKAKKENLWFYSTYQHLWFSPEELKAEQAEGRYIWDAINWTLRDPLERLVQLQKSKLNIELEIEDFKKRAEQYIRHE